MRLSSCLINAVIKKDAFSISMRMSTVAFHITKIFIFLIQALLAGNAVVIKPSEVTPTSALEVQAIFSEAGFPQHLVQVVLGDGETGAALIDAGVDKICFTGSVATGRLVGEACGRALIPCTLELGGKDPLIVCADANLERAANGAVFGGYMNLGQFCCGTERVFVVESVADEFLRRVVEKTQALRLGPTDEFDLGPFISHRQLQVVERHLAEAVQQVVGPDRSYGEPEEGKRKSVQL